MKNQADKHRREVELELGDWVLFKIRPYRMRSVSRHPNEKLGRKTFDPYAIKEWVAKVAYKLDQLDGTTLHPTFHISQQQKTLGLGHDHIHILIPPLNEQDKMLNQRTSYRQGHHARGPKSLLNGETFPSSKNLG